MNTDLAAVLYLVAGVLFILSLRGLSSPASSRRGNFLGMTGMGIAIATTLAAHPPADGIGWVRRKPSTSARPATSMALAWLKCRSASPSAR
jgi:hypothetical protein